MYDLGSATRSETKAELELPTNWSDDALAVYLSFYSTDSRNEANSICLKNDAFSGEPDIVNPDQGGSGSGGSDGDQGENPLG